MAGGKRGEISGAGAGTPGGRADWTVPWVRQSNLWVAACRSNKCLSKPVVLRVLGQPVKLNARVASRSGALEPWDWTNGRAEHMVLQKYCPSPWPLDSRKHLQELLDLPSIIGDPPWKCVPCPCLRPRPSARPCPSPCPCRRHPGGTPFKSSTLISPRAIGQITPGRVGNKSPKV